MKGTPAFAAAILAPGGLRVGQLLAKQPADFRTAKKNRVNGN
jgi:hypothetical protein